MQTDWMIKKRQHNSYSKPKSSSSNNHQTHIIHENKFYLRFSIIAEPTPLRSKQRGKRSVQDNQDYHMNIKQDWASASISIIYKIGKYKEKTTKDVDTSRMGVN